MCLPDGPVGTGGATGLAAGDCPSRLLVMFSSLLNGFLGLPSKHGKQPISLYTAYTYNTTTLLSSSSSHYCSLSPLRHQPPPYQNVHAAPHTNSSHLQSQCTTSLFATRTRRASAQTELRKSTPSQQLLGPAQPRGTVIIADYKDTPRSSCAPARPESLRL